ncbi:MAG: M15 family metallopeptidase [Fimbriimonadaceae bacterium]
MSWDRSIGRPEPVAALDRIRHMDVGEPLVSLLEHAPEIVIHRDSVIPYLRETVVRMLKDAQTRLPEGVRFGVTDAWRPLQRQVRIYERMTAWLKEAKPELPPHVVKRTVNRWVAPPNRKAPPGHCTGAAVDLVLLNAQGEVLDTTSPFDRLRGAPTFSYGLTPEARANRMMLYEAMMAAGFSNCRDEWWHYSYGDAGWAVRMGLDTCIYDAIDLPMEKYAEKEEVWVRLFQSRPNPFLPTPD